MGNKEDICELSRRVKAIEDVREILQVNALILKHRSLEETLVSLVNNIGHINQQIDELRQSCLHSQNLIKKNREEFVDSNQDVCDSAASALARAKDLTSAFNRLMVVVETMQRKSPSLKEVRPNRGSKTLSDLKLSVRARRTMARLKVGSIAELVQFTADEIIAVKNCGQSTLAEIRQKLAAVGMHLKGDKRNR